MSVTFTGTNKRQSAGLERATHDEHAPRRQRGRPTPTRSAPLESKAPTDRATTCTNIFIATGWDRGWWSCGSRRAHGTCQLHTARYKTTTRNVNVDVCLISREQLRCAPAATVPARPDLHTGEAGQARRGHDRTGPDGTGRGRSMSASSQSADDDHYSSTTTTINVSESTVLLAVPSTAFTSYRLARDRHVGGKTAQ